MCHAAMSQNRTERGCSVRWLTGKAANTPPLRVFPSHMRLDKKAIVPPMSRAERGHESDIAEFLPETEVEIDSLMQRAMFFEKVVFDGNPDARKREARPLNKTIESQFLSPKKKRPRTRLYTVVQKESEQGGLHAKSARGMAVRLASSSMKLNDCKSGKTRATIARRSGPSSRSRWLCSQYSRATPCGCPIK